MSEETYECAGCAGEVSVVEAVWIDGKPWCCADCNVTKRLSGVASSMYNMHGALCANALDTITRLQSALAAMTAERDTALAQCKAWREEAEAWRAWWPLNVKSDTTERRTATEPNEADIIATDAWDVIEAARDRTDALAKKQGDTSCLE